MKEVLIHVFALLMISCTNNCSDFVPVEQEEPKVVVTEDYRVMYDFLQSMVESEVFEDLGLSMPDSPTYDDLMYICAPLVMSVQFGDTFAEGDCEKEYRLMLSYFEVHDPEADITKFLTYIIENHMY